jgi:hypothetical protein
MMKKSCLTLVVFITVTTTMGVYEQFAREMDRANVQHDCYPRHLVRVQLEPEDLASVQSDDIQVAFRPRRFDIRTPPTDEHLSTAESMAIAMACIESTYHHFAPVASDYIGTDDTTAVPVKMETTDIYSTIMKPLDLMVQQWHGFTRKKKQKQERSANEKTG